MPKLLLFAPCQKAIIDQRENTASLIAVIETFTVPIGDPIADNAQIPLNWAIVSLWLRELGEEDKSFEQRTEVILPNGDSVLNAVISFQPIQLYHRNTVTVFGYPIAQSGKHTLRLSIRESGESNPWEVVAEFPILVEHRPIPQP
jgi:hypothetical protein